ncbi:MAG TPA: MFS transporter [Thermomicrobiales bacterium]|jgi:MFS family permease
MSDRFHFLPATATRDAAILLRARAVRAFGDGFVSILLPLYLTTLGLSPFQVGAVATATLLGSAALTLYVGLIAARLARRTLLTRVAYLMIGTGIGFAIARDFWPLLIIAFVGTINPSAGDVSVFLPSEQALLPQTIAARERTALFARYGLTGSLVAAFGALCAGVPGFIATHTGLDLRVTLNAMFVVYAFLGLTVLVLYRGLSPAIEPTEAKPSIPLGPSRRIVFTLAALFSLDSFASGFVVQSLLALWLFQKFGLSPATTGLIFFWSGLLSATSQLLAPRLAAKIGLVNTMVFTHLPANIFLILVPFMPNLPLALAFLLARSVFSQMDSPARTSYVMAVVSPPERPAAASVTNVPRSLATALSPLLAGALLARSPFGWPLVIGGGLKALYDLLLLSMFRAVRPPEERDE